VTVEDYTEPVLPGPGASDYERYLRTEELLALLPVKQKFFPEFWEAGNRLTELANEE
jgi:hypothetical protein